MFPPFPQEKAAKVLYSLIQSLASGETALVQVSRESEERKNQGVMLGALVCEDENGNEVNLITNSGIAKKLKTENGKRKTENSAGFNFQIAGPVVSAQEIENALSENDAEIHALTEKIKKENSRELRELREKLCSSSLEKVYALYEFHCIDGKLRSLKEICGMYNKEKLPPTGTGDCCAPKLLDYAFSHKLRPVSLAETKYKTPSGNNCSFPLVPPCDERCGIILPAMLGLRILWRDDSICVVNKQSGVLSVPGRGEDKQDSIESRFRRLFGDKVEIKQPAVHRLDMETSGIMILAFTKEAHRELNRQFEAKEVQKEYTALLDGVLPKMGIAPHGQMELFFRLDVENRPHQIWDRENGKSAVTEWEISGVERYHAPDGTTRNATRVLFKPHTGRTHQLRLAAADSHGFNCPIIGDTLYGKCEKGERLMLHAKKISFKHPVTKEQMTIECREEF
ncbi:MAG: RluA family pseudouridine synthase [Treponema sp.]|nr:RluA family pseudouridine synthase [Treponema sp.]